jgi:hypothetical protein
MRKISSSEFKAIDDFHFANKLKTGDKLAVKYLGSKSVNSLRLSEISRELEAKLGKN